MSGSAERWPLCGTRLPRPHPRAEVRRQRPARPSSREVRVAGERALQMRDSPKSRRSARERGRGTVVSCALQRPRARIPSQSVKESCLGIPLVGLLCSMCRAKPEEGRKWKG